MPARSFCMNTTSSRLSVIPATDEHASMLADFFCSVWNATGGAADVLASRARAAATNPVEPGVHPPTYVAVQGDRVIGYCSSLPVRHWDGIRERGGYWAKGLMVLPEFRNGPVGAHVLKSLTRAMPLATSVTVASGSKRLFGALGYSAFGAMGNYLRPLRIGPILKRLDPSLLSLGRLPSWAPRSLQTLRDLKLAGVCGALGTAGLAGLTALRGRSRDRVERVLVPTAHDLTTLWQRARSGIAAGPVRNAAALLTRYASPDAGARYHFAFARRDGQPVGLAVVREPGGDGDPRLQGIRVASFSDFLFDPRDQQAAAATVRAGMQLARDVGADAVIASASHHAAVAALRRQLFLPLGGTIHFFLRDEAKSDQWPAALESWWLTRGDGYSDESF